MPAQGVRDLTAAPCPSIRSWRAFSPGTPPGGQSMENNRWRTVDIVVAAILAIAFGVVFYAWDRLWAGTDSLFAGFPPIRATIAGVWFLPAVLGPLVIRKSGSGVFTETVAAAISALLGTLGPGDHPLRPVTGRRRR